MVSTLTRDRVERVSQVLAVLGEPHRLQIMRQLRRGARPAGFLAEAVGMSPSLTSHHLSVLVEADLVKRRQVGTFVCYSANRARVKVLHRELGALAGALMPDDEETAAGPC